MAAAPPTTWANRITGAGSAAPEQLLANPRNPRRHSATQQEAMKAVLERVGWVTDVIVNETTGHVVDGHMRVELAMRAGIPEIPVKYVQLSEAEEAEVLATFDPLANLAYMDRAVLAELVGDVDEAEEDARLDVLIGSLRKQSSIGQSSDWLSQYKAPDYQNRPSFSDAPRPEPDAEPEAEDDDAPPPPATAHPDPSSFEVPPVLTMNFAVAAADRPTILEALRQAQDAAGVSTQGEALVNICRAYLGEDVP